MRRPAILYVTFHKSTGARCCTFEQMPELLEAHPPDKYDVVEYAPIKKRRKTK